MKGKLKQSRIVYVLVMLVFVMASVLMYKQDANAKCAVCTWTLMSSKSGTCVTRSSKVYVCKNCGNTKTETGSFGSHSYTGATTTTQPTCTSYGKKVTKCAYCSSTTTTTFGSLAPHSTTTTTVRSATCTTDGQTRTSCKNCSYSYTTTISKKGHNYGVISTTNPTCTADGVRVKRCSNCGDVISEKYGNATGHSYTTRTTKNATCIAAGTKTTTCSNSGCTYSKNESIPATGVHNYQTVSSTNPTCTTDGVIVKRCSGCNGTTTTSNGAKTGHSMKTISTVAPTCTTDGTITKKCQNSGCSYTTTEANGTKTGHNYDTTKTYISVVASCIKEGTKVTPCTKCGATKQESIPKANHNYSKLISSVDATCVSAGSKTYQCSVCNASTKTDSVAINPNNHDYKVVSQTRADANLKVTRTWKCQRTGCGATKQDTITVSPSDVKVSVSFNVNGGDGGNNIANRTVTYKSAYGSLPAAPTKVGYNFAGWYTAASGGTQVTASTIVNTVNDHTLYAHWTVKTLKISFNTNGGSGTASAITVTYGKTYGTLPSGITRTGYDFVGWYTAASGGSKVVSTTTVTVNADQTLYAHWNPRTYKVTFNGNGGSGAENISAKSVTFGSTYGSMPAGPTKAGYTFEGWYTAASGGSKIVSTTTVSTAKDHVLYAHWKANTYTVTFNANSGTVSPSTMTVTYDSAYGTLPTPTRKGYKFVGWYTAASGGSKVTATSVYTTVANSTLYAHWTANKYTVSYDLMGGTGTADAITVTFGQTYGSVPAAPKKTGYTFAGWFTAATSGSQVTSTTKVTTAGNHTLYAHWTANTYKVSFNGNGGSGAENISAKTVTYGSTYGTMPAGPTKAGYSFGGWYTAASGGSKISSNTVVTKAANHTLYAHFTAKKYTVSFDTNGAGISVAAIQIPYDGTYEQIPTITRKGYKFLGWYTAASGGTKITTSTVMKTAANQTLYAHWQAKTFKVTFDGNGGLGAENISAKTVTYASTYGTMPAGPTRAGYTFAGWYTAASGGSKITSTTTVSITADQVLYAHWTAKKYDVSFDMNGGKGTPENIQVTFGSAYGTLPTITKAGYDFVGWYTQLSGGTKITTTSIVSIASHHTLYAHWKAKTLTVSFDANGSSDKFDAKKVTYKGVYDSLPADPIRTGYTFKGWFTAASGGTQVFAGKTVVTATKNHTLYAQWTPKSYKVTFDVNGGNAGNGIGAMTVTYDAEYGKLPAAPTRAGYKFSGWFTKASGGSLVTASTYMRTAKNHTLYAQWTPITYTVTFVPGDGEAEYGRKVKYGETYGSNIITLEKPGYDFKGWYTAQTGGTKVTSSTVVSTACDHKLYARFAPHTFKVTFNVNGGADGNNISALSVKYLENYGSLPAGPTRAGYEFKGWYTAKSGGTKVTSTTQYTAVVDTVLYAQWTAKKYNVKFDINGGNGGQFINSMSVKFGGTYGKLPADPTRQPGYTFDGWYTAKTGGTKITASSKVTIASDHTLYAHWKGVSVTVSFDVNGGDGAEFLGNRSFEYNAMYGSNLPAGPSRAGYTFDGWYTAKTGGTKITSGSYVTKTEAHTLYAHWTANKYTIVFNGNGNKSGSMDSVSCTYDKSVTLPKNAFVRTGYVLKSWNTKSDGSGKSYADGASVKNLVTTKDGSITLYAQWVKGYTITFEYRDDAGRVEKITVPKGESFEMPSCEQYDSGIEFDGWSADGVLTLHEYDPKTTHVPDGDWTFYGVWKLKEYTIEYNTGIAPIDDFSRTVFYTQDYQLPVLKWEGYHQTGWTKSQFGSGKVDYVPGQTIHVTSNMKLYARWESNTYDVYYDANGGEGAPEKQTKVYGVDLTISSTVPTKDNYKFAGWTLKYDTMDKFDQIVAAGAEVLIAAPGVYYNPVQTSVKAGGKYTENYNVTLVAKWERDTYFVYYHSEGASANVPAVQKKKAGETIKLTTLKPIKDGYKFLGWSRDSWQSKPDTKYNPGSQYSVDNDLDLFAIWEECEEDDSIYRIYYDANLGYGAPKTQEFKKDETASISEVVPKRTGYAFVGWAYLKLPDKVEFMPGDAYNDKRELNLIAVWAKIYDDSLMKDMQSKYGSSIMTTEKFTTNYESPYWEKISSKEYFIIKTETFEQDKVLYATSVMFFMKNVNGALQMDSINAEGGYVNWLIVDLIEKSDNQKAQAILTGFTTLKTATSLAIKVFVPGGKEILLVNKYLKYFNDGVQFLEDASKYDAILKDIHKVGFAATLKKCMDEKDASRLNLCISYFESVCKGLLKSGIMIMEDADPLGNYDIAITYFKNSMKKNAISDGLIEGVQGTAKTLLNVK